MIVGLVFVKRFLFLIQLSRRSDSWKHVWEAIDFSRQIMNVVNLFFFFLNLKVILLKASLFNGFYQTSRRWSSTWRKQGNLLVRNLLFLSMFYWKWNWAFKFLLSLNNEKHHRHPFNWQNIVKYCAWIFPKIL